MMKYHAVRYADHNLGDINRVPKRFRDTVIKDCNSLKPWLASDCYSTPCPSLPLPAPPCPSLPLLIHTCCSSLDLGLILKKQQPSTKQGAKVQGAKSAPSASGDDW